MMSDDGEQTASPTLSVRDWWIVQRRLEGATCSAIGKEFGLTKQRVEQIIAKALRVIDRLVK